MMLYRIRVNLRTFLEYPPTSLDDVDDLEDWDVECPFNNSVASFRKWVVEEMDFFYPRHIPQDALDPSTYPRTFRDRSVRIRFYRDPPNDDILQPDTRRMLGDDEKLQYDEVVYVEYLKEN